MTPPDAEEAGALLEQLEDEAIERGVSKEQYVRRILRNRHEPERLTEAVDSLREEASERESLVEELETKQETNAKTERELRSEVRTLEEELRTKTNRIRNLEVQLARAIQSKRALEERVEELERRISDGRRPIDGTEPDDVSPEGDELSAEPNGDPSNDTDRVEELTGELDTLSERLETRENRIQQLETQLAKRSQIEERVDELALVVKEDSAATHAPFFVRWWRWLKNSRRP